MSVVSRQPVDEPWRAAALLTDPQANAHGIPVSEPDLQARGVVDEVPLDVARIVGQSPAMLKLREDVRIIGASSAPVLITGQSGTGKELVARALHDESRSARGPFVSLNCAVFPESLLEGELFGHERDPFTGAASRRTGRIQAASGGTLFLDDVAEMPALVQAKLLRTIDEGAVEPFGASQPVAVNVRIISATHRDLRARIASGLFRQDLYHRIRGIELRVPTLREREGDLELLVDHFLQAFWEWPTPPSIHPRALSALRGYEFGGNVRELRYAIQRAAVMAGGEQVDVHHLPPEILASPGRAGRPEAPVVRLADALHERERTAILDALRHCRGRRSRTAMLLGISRKTLWQKVREHGISTAEIV